MNLGSIRDQTSHIYENLVHLCGFYNRVKKNQQKCYRNPIDVLMSVSTTDPNLFFIITPKHAKFLNLGISASLPHQNKNSPPEEIKVAPDLPCEGEAPGGNTQVSGDLIHPSDELPHRLRTSIPIFAYFSLPFYTKSTPHSPL